MNILIGVTGSVAAIKLNELYEGLTKSIPHSEIRIVATKAALNFISDQDRSSLPILTDKDEWSIWQDRGDPVLHIELRKWADLMVVAPLDANTLAKMASGICDNLLTCILRAWDWRKPLVLCPAMNTAMWEHPLTKDQITRVSGFGVVTVIPPIEKKLVCGDIGTEYRLVKFKLLGMGAMEEPERIIAKVKEIISSD